MESTAAVYARVSVDHTDEAVGVARQQRECERWASEHGFTVTEVYVDNSISASSGKLRPEFERLLRDKPERVVVWHLDRLLRHSSRDLERVLDAGFLVHSLKGGDFDLATPTGRALARTVVAWAQNEVELKGERQRASNRERAEEGRLYGRVIAYGWKDLEGREVDATVAAKFRQAVEDLIAGASLREVAERWNAEGFRSPAGKRWTPVTARQALLRPMNAGIVTIDGTERRDIEAKWKPLFDVMTYDALRTALASRRLNSNTTAPRTRKHLMTGLVRCDKCDLPMQAQPAHGKQPACYVCSGTSCYRSIAVHLLDEFVLQRTAMLLVMQGPERFLSRAAVARLAELDQELEQLRAERTEAAKADLSVSSKVALLGALDAREAELRAEAAGLTKDSAIASLVRALTVPPDTGDVEADVLATAGVEAVVVQRLGELSLRQRRMVVSSFASYRVLGGRARPSVRVKVGPPLEG